MPSIVPTRVAAVAVWSASSPLASPKSSTFTIGTGLPDTAVRNTFAGFRSRWMMPAEWAADTPAQSCAISS